MIWRKKGIVRRQFVGLSVEFFWGPYYIVFAMASTEDHQGNTQTLETNAMTIAIGQYMRSSLTAQSDSAVAFITRNQLAMRLWIPPCCWSREFTTMGKQLSNCKVVCCVYFSFAHSYNAGCIRIIRFQLEGSVLKIYKSQWKNVVEFLHGGFRKWDVSIINHPQCGSLILGNLHNLQCHADESQL